MTDSVSDPVSVHAAIAGVIRDLPAVGKDSRIEEGPQKYNYRGIEAIKAALKPHLAAHGVHYAPCDIEQIADSTYATRNGAEWQRIRMVVRYRVYGPAGDFIEAVGRGEGADNSDKACNKAMTVAEKQMLGQVFCIADADGDPDQSRAEEQITVAPRPDVPVKGLKGALAAAIGAESASVWWDGHKPGDGPFAAGAADLMVADAKAWHTAREQAAAEAPFEEPLELDGVS